MVEKQIEEAKLGVFYKKKIHQQNAKFNREKKIKNRYSID
jgi:hypothetical protein